MFNLFPKVRIIHSSWWPAVGVRKWFSAPGCLAPTLISKEVSRTDTNTLRETPAEASAAPTSAWPDPKRVPPSLGPPRQEGRCDRGTPRQCQNRCGHSILVQPVLQNHVTVQTAPLWTGCVPGCPAPRCLRCSGFAGLIWNSTRPPRRCGQDHVPPPQAYGWPCPMELWSLHSCTCGPFLHSISRVAAEHLCCKIRAQNLF